MIIKNINSSKKAFTVAELVVATAVFILFLGAVFSLYRIGSRMYVSGSWKYYRQKQAERFFQILKERVEQASDVVAIEPKLSGSTGQGEQVIAKDTKFAVLKNNSSRSVPLGGKASTREWLAEFIVAKPDMTKLPGNKRGIVLYHSLVLVPNQNSGLYDLHLHVANSASGDGFFEGVDPGFSFGNLTIANFSAPPENYGLAPVPHSFVLSDVSSVTVSIVEAVDKSNVERAPVFGISVEMRNPKHERTSFVVTHRAKIESSVEILERE